MSGFFVESGGGIPQFLTDNRIGHAVGGDLQAKTDRESAEARLKEYEEKLTAARAEAKAGLLDQAPLDFVGNDFALDDISFQVVPIPQTVWLFGTALLFLIGLKRKSSS